jgi:hypothetical protein
MNIAKAKCDELDHHPDWSLNGNTLDIKLSTHDHGNNVTLKDWELAAYFTQIYEEGSFKYDKTKMCYLKYLTGLGLLVGSIYIALWIYNLKTKYRFTSENFIFSKIDRKPKH